MSKLLPSWWWPDVRAGWVDAHRTPGARPWRGFRWGGIDYGIGYALGAIVR